MGWETYTSGEQVESWLASLSLKQQDAVLAAIELLEEHGPALGRPFVDRVHGSRHQKMKELRPVKVSDAVLRVLFAFDSERRGALLIGGNKAERSRWQGWYATWIPVADDLLDEIEERLARARENRGNEAKAASDAKKRQQKRGTR